MPSSRNLNRLPESALLRNRCRVFALIDSIMAPDFPSFEFHPKWRRGEQLAVFKNGSGDHVYLWFSPQGTVIRGFDHESKMTPFRCKPNEIWRGMFDGFPKRLAYARKEPAFALEEITFCLWSEGNGAWERGKVVFPRGVGRDPDGSKWLLSVFAPNYARWAKEYYGRKLEPRALDRLWRENPLDAPTLFSLNPSAKVKVVLRTAKEMGWPVDPSFSIRSKPPPTTKKIKLSRAKRPRTFGEAEFAVLCEPTVVKMMIHGDRVVASVKANIYRELFELVKARILAERRSLRAKE